MKNESPPLISVVMPVYNVRFYVREAIDSILNQTIQDFEMIVIDDCYR
jgi:glycosyltransferase involved in cell wall biosynthesis